jgi:tetratricopeptide (TPR) repeat protein
MDQLGDTEGAQKYLIKAIEVSRAALAKKPESDTFKSELANSIGGLAKSELTLGHLEKARELYEEESALRDSFSPDFAAGWESRRELTGLFAQLAERNIRIGNLEEARRLYDRAFALRTRIAAERPDSWPARNDVALAFNNLGTMQFPNGNAPGPARKLHRQALEIFRQRAKADPSDSKAKRSLADTLYFDANCALHEGDKDGAAAAFRECLALRKELATDSKDKVLQAELMLAQARCGDHVEAARKAHTLVATLPLDENLCVLAACGYALAAGAAAGDDGLVKSYTARALDCLRKANDKGWAVVVVLKKDTDLEPIRNDPAFQALIGELERAGKK